MNKPEEIQRVADVCRQKLDLQHLKSGDEYGYNSVPLCIIDAIFSIGVRYTSTRNTVQRFIDYFNISAEFTVSQFVDLYDKHSIEFMAEEVYENRQRTSPKSGILKADAVLRVAQLLKKYDVETLDNIARVVRNPQFELEYKQIPGQKSGISLRYLYMLLGVEDEIKPDRMVLRFLENVLQRNVSLDEAVSMIVDVAKQLQSDFAHISPRSLDYAIWQLQSGNQG